MGTLRAAVTLTFGVTERWPDNAWSWGDLGHTIVCEIAFHELNDTAREQVVA